MAKHRGLGSYLLQSHRKIASFAAGLLVVAILLALSVPKSPHTLLGNDISYPQCGHSLPRDQAFGIVGVNGGLASTPNGCLTQQLDWMNRSTGAAKGQPRMQLYVNTGNPGEHKVAAWPKDNHDRSDRNPTNPYGECKGANNRACAWQYGWNQAHRDIYEHLKPAAQRAAMPTHARDYIWWLDVETKNSWQYGSLGALARNAAVLEGMTARLQADGATVGIYSTSHQWRGIVGELPPKSNLRGLDSWLAGARDAAEAKQRCSATPLSEGGKVVMVQYVFGPLDYNYSCT